MIEIITVILAFLMLIATGIYVYYTKQLLGETIKLREVETSPFINAHIDIGPGASRIIKHIGNSPTYNLKITFEESILNEIRKEMYTDYQAEIEYFGVDQHIEIPFYTEKLTDKNLKINFYYKSKDEKELTEEIILGLKPLKKMNFGYPKLPYEDILKNIGKEIEKLKKIIFNFVTRSHDFRGNAYFNSN